LIDLNFTTVLDLIGTFAFAISGIKMASGKKIDLFGAYILGLVTAIGGGTIRDLMLGLKPFWMLDSSYFWMTAFALIVTILFKEGVFKFGKTLFIFDTVGLGLFTVVGISKSFEAGLDPWVCVVMGTITGAFGGIVRDVLLNTVPLVFQKDIYALACVGGGVVYFASYFMGLSPGITEVLAAVSVIVIRLIVIRFHVHLPILNTGNGVDDKKGDT